MTAPLASASPCPPRLRVHRSLHGATNADGSARLLIGRTSPLPSTRRARGGGFKLSVRGRTTRVTSDACLRCTWGRTSGSTASTRGDGGARRIVGIVAANAEGSSKGSGVERDDGKATARDGEVGEGTRAGGEVTEVGEVEDEKDGPVIQLALAMLRFYRTQISPLTPPACRFIPTCSQYSMAAFKKFGATRGFVLTAWRIIRCNPWGGTGYDPPVWPPVRGFRDTAGPKEYPYDD